MRQLFGTDGVRGVANRDLTPDLTLALGRAAAQTLASQGESAWVGRDTRLSGPLLEAALVAGMCSAGVDVRLCGIVPSPAVSWLVSVDDVAFGGMISASHNPVPDNGVKFFSGEGLKLSSEVEVRIEAAMQNPPQDLPVGESVGSSRVDSEAAARYEEHLLGAVGAELGGLTIVLDCAFGSAYEIAPRVFERTGARVTALHAEPDGGRINVECGSTSTAKLASAVVESGADLGLAFDGDADRVIAVDERGRTVDGDMLIAIAALALSEDEALKNGVVVSTVMGNLAFRLFLESRGIEVVLAPVGDKFVAEAMAERGAVLGGEQSGHIIYADHVPTGDGILAGLKLAHALRRSGEPMSVLGNLFEPFPQVLKNVPIESRGRLEGAEEMWARIEEIDAALGDEGRVLVRPSGTEPLVRVMVEAPDEASARATADRVVALVQEHVGH